MKNFKTIAIAFLLFLTTLLYLKNVNLSESEENLLSIYDAKQSKIERLINDNGEIIQQRQNAVASKKEIEAYYKDLVKDLEENHNLKVEQIKAFYRGKLQAVGTGKNETRDTTIYVTVPGTTDTIREVRTYHLFNDGYLNYTAIGDQSKYEYTDSLSYAFFDKKVGSFWNRRTQSFTSVYTQNPNSEFKNFESVLIQEKRIKKISIGAGIGIGTDGVVRPQIQLHYSLLRL